MRFLDGLDEFDGFRWTKRMPPNLRGRLHEFYFIFLQCHSFKLPEMNS